MENLDRTRKVFFLIVGVPVVLVIAYLVFAFIKIATSLPKLNEQIEGLVATQTAVWEDMLVLTINSQPTTNIINTPINSSSLTIETLSPIKEIQSTPTILIDRPTPLPTNTFPPLPTNTFPPPPTNTFPPPPTNTPLPIPHYPVGDFNYDCIVNMADFDIFEPHYLPCGNNYTSGCSTYDLNGDQAVNIADFSILAQQIGAGATCTYS